MIAGKPHWDSTLDLAIAALDSASRAGGDATEVVNRAETYAKFLLDFVSIAADGSPRLVTPSPDLVSVAEHA